MRKKKGVAWLLSAVMLLSSVPVGMIPVAAEPIVEMTESVGGDVEEIAIEEETQDTVTVEENVGSKEEVEEKVGVVENEPKSGGVTVTPMTLEEEYTVTLNDEENIKWFSFTPSEDGDYQFYFPNEDPENESYEQAWLYDSMEETVLIVQGYSSFACALEKNKTYYLKAGVVEWIDIEDAPEYKVAVKKISDIVSMELTVDNPEIPDFYKDEMLSSSFNLKITYADQKEETLNIWRYCDPYGRRLEWSVDEIAYSAIEDSPMNIQGSHTLSVKHHNLQASVSYRICDGAEWLKNNAEEWDMQSPLELTKQKSVYRLKNISEKTYKLIANGWVSAWVFNENGEEVTRIEEVGSFDIEDSEEAYYLYVCSYSENGITIQAESATTIKNVEVNIPPSLPYNLQQNPFWSGQSDYVIQITYEDNTTYSIKLSECYPGKDKEGNEVVWEVVNQKGEEVWDWYQVMGSYRLVVTIGREVITKEFSVSCDSNTLETLQTGNNTIQIPEGEYKKYYQFTPNIGGDYLLGNVTKLRWIRDTNGVNKEFDGDISDEFGSCGIVSLRKDQTYIFCFRSDYNEDEYTFIISSIAEGTTESLNDGENMIQLTWNVPKVYKVSHSGEQGSISYYDVSASGQDVSMMVWYEGKTASNGLSQEILLTNKDYLVITGSGNVTLTVTEKQTKITDISFEGNLPEISVLDYLHQIQGTVDVTFIDASGKINTEQIGFAEVSRFQNYVIRMYLKDVDGNIFNHSDTSGTFELCVSTAGLEKKIGDIVVNDLNTEENICVNESRTIGQKLFQYYRFVPEYTATYRLQGNREFEGTLVFYDADASQKVDTEWGQAELKAGKTYYVGGKKYDDGDLTLTLTMVQTPIKEASVAYIPAQTYTGSVIKPKPTVNYDGKTLSEKKDYTLSYRNNKNRGTATIIITGKGDYVGTKEVQFNIVQPTASVVPPVTPEVTEKSLEKIAFMEAIPDQAYTGKVIEPELVIKLKDGNEKLKKDVDYTVSYSSNVEPGTAHVTVTGKGDYTGKLEGIFAITGKMPQTIAVDARQVKGLKNRTMSDKPATIRYTEEPKTDVVYSSSNEKVATVDENGVIRYVGTGTAVITAKAEETDLYEGAEVNLTVNVGLKKVSFTPIGYNDKFRVTTNTVKGAVKWQVQYSTKKNFANAKTKTYTSAGRLYRQYVKAGDKTTYYIRMRAIRGSYKSDWSDVKKVTTK